MGGGLWIEFLLPRDASAWSVQLLVYYSDKCEYFGDLPVGLWGPTRAAKLSIQTAAADDIFWTLSVLLEWSCSRLVYSRQYMNEWTKVTASLNERLRRINDLNIAYLTQLHGSRLLKSKLTRMQPLIHSPSAALGCMCSCNWTEAMNDAFWGNEKVVTLS